jgi:hypothetical protein
MIFGLGQRFAAGVACKMLRINGLNLACGHPRPLHPASGTSRRFVSGSTKLHKTVAEEDVSSVLIPLVVFDLADLKKKLPRTHQNRTQMKREPNSLGVYELELNQGFTLNNSSSAIRSFSTIPLSLT